MTRTSILTVVPDFPLPAHSGYNLRNWHLHSNLARHADLTLLARSRTPVEAGYLKQCEEAEVQAEVFYEPPPSLGEKIAKGFRFLVSPYPFSAAGWYFPKVADRLARLLSRGYYQAVMVESVLLCAYWPIIRRCSALKVLDLHNLETELFRRQARLVRGPLNRLLHYHETLKMGRIEDRLIREADLVFVTSARERRLLQDRGIQTAIEVIPNGVDCRRLAPLPPTSSRNLLFVGTMDYLPNEDGVLFFSDEVLPTLQARFESIRFTIVGRNPSPAVLELGKRKGIEVTGEVTDLESYYRDCLAAVVPLRAGGGTRLKILEAMAYGRPVVSTSVGCEGIDCVDDEHLLIADTAEQMVAAIEHLISQPESAKRLAKNGRTLVEQTYGWDQIVRQVMAVIRNKIDGALSK